MPWRRDIQYNNLSSLTLVSCKLELYNKASFPVGMDNSISELYSLLSLPLKQSLQSDKLHRPVYRDLYMIVLPSHCFNSYVRCEVLGIPNSHGATFTPSHCYIHENCCHNLKKLTRFCALIFFASSCKSAPSVYVHNM